MHIVGFQPEDEQWAKMKAAWEACRAVGADPPEDVLKFFGYESPGSRPGREVELGEAKKGWHEDGRSGYDVVLADLPEGVSVIRFYNAW